MRALRDLIICILLICLYGTWVQGHWVYNLPGILTGSYQHEERKASLKMKKKSLKKKTVNKPNLEKQLKRYSPNR